MKTVLALIEQAQKEFRKLLTQIDQSGGLTQERYVNYLSMQYHLTNGVQRHFYTCAGHHSLMHKKPLRKFLVQFAEEEEAHYLIAAKDLEHMGIKPKEAPIDVMLWWSFFDSIINEKPFVRLGATCILENVAVTNGDLIKKLIADQSYLNPRNTKFVVIHQHEELPHGSQIIDALTQANLNGQAIEDLELGARIGMKLYLAMFAECI